MPKLKKTRSYSVGPEIIEVDFQGTICECANLLKSGIKNQNTILVSYNDIWNEVNVLDHGGDDSYLQGFKHFVNTMNLSLVDFGITTDVKKQISEKLSHNDFVYLSDLFPNYDYVQISVLNDFEIKNVNRTGIDHLKDSLKYLESKKLTVEQYISETEISKKQIIESMKKPDVKKIEVIDAEIVSNEKSETIVNPVAPSKKPISLQVFETLTPDRISELQGLKEAQLKIVNDNPVITIIDKETYELAKKTAATLLSASTNIDGSNGLATQANKYLNTFKTMLKTAFDPIAKLTRDPYDKQKQLISAWENAEELKKQAIERAKLLKIKERTDKLFAVPFVFNGTMYSIGNIYVTPSQIESATDEEFNVFILNGTNVKNALDAEAAENIKKDAEIAELKKKLAMLENMSNTDPEPNNSILGQTGTIQQASQSNTDKITANIQAQASSYSVPNAENQFLNSLDMEHIEHIEKPAYIKCRGYYVRALVDVAKELDFILNDNAPNALKKSERMTNLSNILKQSV